MATVELRPGDVLNIVWSSTQNTPLGVKEVESSFAFTYDELLQRLRSKGRAGKSRRSGSEGARFSRIVALAVNALRKGEWSTGAKIKRAEVFERLIARFEKLNPAEYPNVTKNARQSIEMLCSSHKILNADQMHTIQKVADLLRLPNNDAS